MTRISYFSFVKNVLTRANININMTIEPSEKLTRASAEGFLFCRSIR